MPSRGTRGLWLRGVAAVGACLLALASTGAMVTAAVVGGSNPSSVLAAHSDKKGSDDGSTSPKTTPQPNETKPPKVAPTPKPAATAKPKPAVTPKPEPKPTPHPKPVPDKSTTSHPPAPPTHPRAPAPTPRVVVDTSDPAPFAAQDVAASEATRVLPVEALGPLSGISFGSGLFIWPILVAVDVLALAVIARLALRRRRDPSED